MPRPSASSRHLRLARRADYADTRAPARAPIAIIANAPSPSRKIRSVRCWSPRTRRSRRPPTATGARSDARPAELNSLAMMSWIDKNGGDSKTVEMGRGAGLGHRGGPRDTGSIRHSQEPLLSAALRPEGARARRTLRRGLRSMAYLLVHRSAGVCPSTSKNSGGSLASPTSRPLHEHAQGRDVALMSEVTKIPTSVFAKMTRPTALRPATRRCCSRHRHGRALQVVARAIPARNCTGALGALSDPLAAGLLAVVAPLAFERLTSDGS